MSWALNIRKYLLNTEGEFVSYQWEVKLKEVIEKRARKDMRITHPAAMIEQARRASPKSEENGLSVQAESESDDAESRWKERYKRSKRDWDLEQSWG